METAIRPETVTIAGIKVWDDDDNAKGRRPDSITVNLLASGGKVDSQTVKAGSDGTWRWSFAGKAKYQNGTEINYTVSEETVTDYTPTYELKGGSYVITNTYTPAGFDTISSSITDQIDVEKKLTGRTLQERQGSAGGVTYDQQTYTITTTVSDRGKGTLSATHVISAKADARVALFTNTNEAAPALASISAVKHLTGKDLKDGQFTFQLKDEKGKVIDEAKNDENGVIAFKELSFDAVGTYHYTISEVNDRQKNIQYDDSEKTAVITVKDGGNGTLEAPMETSGELVFTNAYDAGGSGGDPSDDPGNNGSGAGTDGNGGNGQSSINGSGAKTGDSADIARALGLMLIAATTAGILLVRRRLERSLNIKIGEAHEPILKMSGLSDFWGS